MSTMANWDELLVPATEVARRLLGSVLTRTLPSGARLAGKIVEVEAYDQNDPASHSYRGRTPRTDVMFGPPGHLYVYFTYGMHYCCNVVTGPVGQGSAVLIRAVEPLCGHGEMALNRGAASGPENVNLTNGPAKLCQAFGIDATMNGHELRSDPLTLDLITVPLLMSEIVQTTRIGISQAKDVPWRWYIRNNRYVSRA